MRGIQATVFSGVIEGRDWGDIKGIWLQSD